jgi:hypothetical protein
MLPRLIRRFGAEARRQYPGSSIEASAVESALGIWRAHPGFFARVGYAVTRDVDSGEMLNGEIRYLVRWQPILDWEPEVPTVERLVAAPRGRRVEVDGVRYETAVVREEREWDALAPVWDHLLLATPAHAASQIYEYQRRWWRRARASELFVVLLVREGEIMGIAPLQLEIVKVYGRWCRRLSFIGADAGVERPCFLFPADDARPARALVAALAARSDQWDLCDLHGELGGPHGSAELQSAFHSAGFAVTASGSRLLASRRTPFFLAAHAFGFRLQLRRGSWRKPVPPLHVTSTTAAHPSLMETL